MPIFLNPLVDYTFKNIFGQSSSGIFLMDFLNCLFEDEDGFDPIVSIQYLDKEKEREHHDLKTMIYDIYCTTSNGRQFIVEMQNQIQADFIDRSVGYASRAIRDQVKIQSLKDRYSFLPVYIVSLLNFSLPELGPDVVVHAGICDLKTGKPISDKLRLTYIQLELFNSKEDECNSPLDKWIFTLKNLKDMEAMPFLEQNNIFFKLLDKVSYAKLSLDEQREYDIREYAYRDLLLQTQYAMDKGLAEGLAKGRAEGAEQKNRENALKMKELGASPEMILIVTGLRL